MEEDHFSKLPRDCLLDVFSRVDRQTLNELECLNSEIKHVVNDPSLKRIKTCGRLYVYEHRSGHSFSMNYDEMNYDCLSFHIPRDTNIGLRSASETEYYEGYFYNYELKYLECNGVRAFNEAVRDGIIDPGTATPVPVELFRNLSMLFEQHYCHHTTFQWIKVDTHFLNHFAELNDTGKTIEIEKKFTFDDAMFDKSLDHEQFAKFLLESNLTNLEIRNARVRVKQLGKFIRPFDEEFIVKFAAAIPCHIAPKFSIFFHSVPIPHYWIASKEFIPVLCRFVDFCAFNMKLDAEAFVELIVMRFDLYPRSTVHVNWQFLLSDELTEDHTKKIDNMSGFSHYSEDSGFVVKKEGAASYCGYKLQNSESGNASVHLQFYEIDEVWNEDDYNVELGDEEDNDDQGEDENEAEA